MKALLEELVDVPRARRDAELARLAGDDAELHAEVERLLAQDVTEGLASPVEGALANLVQGARAEGAGSTLGPGSVLGSYRLERRIGAGGMGEVYEATQESPRRRVALKVLAGRLHRESERSRFRYEAEVLGRLRHPGIAQVFEAGTADGVPFIAMELVEGARSVVEFAREQELELGERLELVEAICAAVSYGHGKGVIHRDLKPSNLLVDSAGHAKVIDFGIARSEGPDAVDRTARTQPGEVVGTLAYMSPEQWEGQPDLIDAQSDVYSLGVVLYELACGRHPFDLEGKSFLEASAVVTMQSPLRPRKASPECPEDLEWILLRALECDRALRYASAAELGAELARFRRHEPVFAGPPSTRYRLGKFVRRNRLAVAAGALVLVSLIVGVIGLGLGLQRARAAERLAQERLAAEQRERAKAEALSSHLTDMTTSVRGSRLGGDTRLVEVLRSSMRDIDRRFADQPDVELEVRKVLGESFESAGDHARSFENYERVLELLEAQPEPDWRALCITHAHLAKARWEASDFESAEAHLQRAEEALTHLPDWPEGRLRIGLLRAWNSRRDAQDVVAGNLEQLSEDCIEALGPTHDVCLDCLEKLAGAYEMMGAPERSLPMVDSILDVRSRLEGPSHPSVLVMRLERVRMLKARGLFLRAIEEALDIRELYRDRFGVDSQQEFEIALEIGVLRRLMGLAAEAEALHRELLERYVRLFGGGDELWALLAVEHATDLLALDRLEEARAAFEDLRNRSAPILREDYFAIRILTGEAKALFALGERDEEAEALLRQALEIGRASKTAPPYVVTAVYQIYVPVLVTQGRHDEALAELELVRGEAGELVAAGNSQLLQLDFLYGVVHYYRNDLETARDELRGTYEKYLGANPGTVRSLEAVVHFLCKVYEDLGQPERCGELRESYEAARAAAVATGI